MRIGARNILVPNPRDLPALAKTISEHRPTVLAGVNTLFNTLLTAPEFADVDLSCFSVSLGGGAAVQKAVSDRWKERTGYHLREGYGLSETSPVLTFNPPSDDFSGTVGLVAPSTDVVLRDSDNNDVPQGQAGEICARGPQVTAGYWNRPDATAGAFTADGYFRTGDVGVFTEDWLLKIADRMKDMILVSGFNVYPNEIEAVLAELPGVVECACVGVPDDRTGEAVKVFLVKSSDDVTAEAVIAHCRAQMAAYKVPREVVFLDALPKSTVGKILRRELRDAS